VIFGLLPYLAVCQFHDGFPFERYAIVSQADIAEALGRLETRGGHSFAHSEPTEDNPDEPATVR
jgi:hypothetical protein